MVNMKQRASVHSTQLELPLTNARTVASVPPPSIKDAVVASTRALPAAPAANLTRVQKPAASPRLWAGFMGRRAPRLDRDELPMNTKRAAHHIRRSSRWLELVRYRENSPPWRKKGGLFEYYESQLDWWQEQLADTW